jgi:hypothetical protein
VSKKIIEKAKGLCVILDLVRIGEHEIKTGETFYRAKFCQIAVIVTLNLSKSSEHKYFNKSKSHEILSMKLSWRVKCSKKKVNRRIREEESESEREFVCVCVCAEREQDK